MFNKIFSFFYNKPIIIFLILTLLIFIDNSIIQISNQLNLLKSQDRSNVFFLITIACIFGTISVLLINRKTIYQNISVPLKEIVLTNKTITFSQIIILILMILIILQIIYHNNTNYIFSIIIVGLSYSIGILISAFFTIKLAKWYISEKEKIILGHSFTMGMICIFILFGLLYFIYEKADDVNQVLEPVKFKVMITQKNNILNIFQNSYFISYILTFIFVWIVTLALLHNYLESKHRIIFYIAFCIPLIYFLLKFTTFGLDLLKSIILLNPSLYGNIYTILFSGTGPLTGLLFFIPLWIFANKIKIPEIKKLSIITSFGMLIFFTANQEPPLQEKIYPPFGIVTASFTGLSIYLYFLGIYSTAIHISKVSSLKDIALRIIQNDKFFKAIGRSQLEQQLKPIVSKIIAKYPDYPIEAELKENEVQDLIMQIKEEMKINMRKNE
jgi:hypothetical protein